MATERRPRARAASPRSRTTSVTARRTSTRKTAKTSRPKTSAKSAKPAAAKGTRRPKGTKATVLPPQVAQAVAAALDKKAEKVQVLDLRKGSSFTDFFIIATGTNIRQVQAIADGIVESLKKDGVRPALVEGYSRAEWILVDYFDFIVHVFTPSTREFYGLERLWGDAEPVEISA